MKLQLRRILSPSFVNAYARLMSLQLTVREAYWLSKAMRVFDQQMKDFQKQQLDIMHKYGFQENVPVSPDKQEEFQKAQAELSPILDSEIEVPLQPISLPATVPMSGRDLLALEGIVEAAGVVEETPKNITVLPNAQN